MLSNLKREPQIFKLFLMSFQNKAEKFYLAAVNLKAGKVANRYHEHTEPTGGSFGP